MNTSSLFKPFQYKNLQLKNRIVMAPMTRAQSDNGVPTQKIADYYGRRAASEIGLILSEGTVINRPGSKNLRNIPDFYGQEALNGWKNVIDTVHRNGGKMGPQIWHVGDTRMSEEYPLVAMEKASTMTIEDIQDTIAQFAASAKSAKDLGLTALKFMEHMDTLLTSFSGK